ncbi:DUF7288 family protein [Natronosalvus vescus]|uniref:DUF7288 family protein n=1 Tax=Natronosalvus vescus TaxID=2953881 RepID=UPI0020919DDE|nr:hypothetical protein [Natronosalvus vescus]
MSGRRSQARKPRPRGGRPLSSTDRGQAFTLEGFVAAFILLIAVLFAVQSVVITPSTGGAVDRTAQAQLQQQTQDALIIAQQENNLSVMVRQIEFDNDDFDGFHNETTGAQGVYSMSDFGNESTLGAVLNQNLDAGQRYNVELHYQSLDPDGDSPEPIKLVDQGSPSSTAVTASYTVVLHGNQSITTPGENRTLADVSDPDEEYIPHLNDGDSLYNVVEVRVVVW